MQAQFSSLHLFLSEKARYCIQYLSGSFEIRYRYLIVATPKLDHVIKIIGKKICF
jgi:hypothetical protein